MLAGDSILSGLSGNCGRAGFREAMAENMGVGHRAPLHTTQAVPCTDDGNGKPRGERLYRCGGLTLTGR